MARVNVNQHHDMRVHGAGRQCVTIPLFLGILVEALCDDAAMVNITLFPLPVDAWIVAVQAFSPPGP
jgi:hypothetical protein